MKLDTEARAVVGCAREVVSAISLGASRAPLPISLVRYKSRISPDVVFRNSRGDLPDALRRAVSISSDSLC